jgi:hypothetical protein
MNVIRGVLLAGGFRTHHSLNGMSPDDQRNTLIVEMVAHSNQSVGSYQALSDADLAGAGAVMVFLLKGGSRTAAELKTMSSDDHRNTMIVGINGLTNIGQSLQGLSNLDLVLLGLGKAPAGSLAPSTYLQGVLLAGGFRNFGAIIAATRDDIRNTLIVEMAAHSNQPVASYQALNDADLAGAGAVMVFLLRGGIRDAAALRTMSADSQRNTAIVEIDGQTGFGQSLQELNNLDLVKTALGVVPKFRWAAFFRGDVGVTGDVVVNGDLVLTGADLAEQFTAEGICEPGSVVVLSGGDRVRMSDTPYDRKVAGVVSGAGSYRPALVMDRRESTGRRPLAMTGKVWCRVDAGFGPVRVGDLLTTSATPGHAMLASDRQRAFGAVIGKALADLDSGCALVPVLVSLQ